MPQHSVKQGDTMLSIAAEHGFPSWETIWMAPENKALRDQRPDAQVLSDGDSVFVPEKKMKILHLETDKKHSVKVQTVKAWFRVALRGNDGEHLANCRFQLDVDGKVKTGMTDASGKIELEIDPKPVEGKLKVYLDEQDPTKAMTWTVKLGHLDPMEKLSGVKGRLSNLGFACGKIDEAMNDETKTALRNFQIVYRLPVTGEADERTKAKLLEIHDQR